MFIGRKRELTAVVEAIQAEQPVVVVGEAGVGKTALIKEAASQSGLRAFYGGGLSTLTWMDHLALVRALGRPMEDGDAPAVANTVCDLVRGGLLVVDDMQWTDSATLQALRFIAGQVPVVCAVRKGDPGAAACLESLPADGFGVESLCPLSDDEAASLVRVLKPELTSDAVSAVVRDGKGNPLLIEQMVLGMDSSEIHRLGLLARLQPHGEDALETVARLALLGRPASREILEGDVDSLLEAGLLHESDGLLALHHELLGAAALEAIGPGTIRSLHAELARIVDDVGEAARHHELAGERSAAHEKALSAASTARRQSERASHLGLAARVAEGDDADRLKLEAAEALVDAGDYRHAIDTVASCSFHSPELRGRAALVRARAHRNAGDRHQAEKAISEGLAVVGDSRSSTEVQLRLQAVELAAWDWDFERALPLAEHALELARASDVVVANAELAMAVACMAALDPTGIEHAVIASELAGRQDDWPLQCEAECVLAQALFNEARVEEARHAIERSAILADRIGARSRLFELKAFEAHIDVWQRGGGRTVVNQIRALLREPLVLGHHLVGARSILALALALSGKDREAMAELTQAQEEGVSDDNRAAVAAYLAEVEWLAGRPLEALGAFAECANYDTPYKDLAAVTAGWAALDLGRRPVEIDPALPIPPIAAGLAPELTALQLLAGGEPEQAEGAFIEAADVWSGASAIAATRSQLGAGIAAIESRSLERGRKLLLMAEEFAVDRDLKPLVSRIRRALRKAGVQRPVERQATPGELTSREQEVLALVRQGLRTREIAAHLGVASSTVNSQIQSAMRKLGSPNRAHAALLATGDDEPAQAR